MQKLLTSLFKITPHLLFAFVLICTQLLFINSNIAGVYLFGVLMTSENKSKVFILSACITLLYDAVKLAPLGSWALSFYTVAICGEILLSTIRIKSELQTSSVRGGVLLVAIISTLAITQVHLLKVISGQTLAQANEFSIVVLDILYVLMHRIRSARNSQGYLHI